MRLGQLSRKLGLRQSEIVAYLAKNNISVEDGSNVRIDDDHVVMVMNQFAPSQLAEVMSEPDEALPEPETHTPASVATMERPDERAATALSEGLEETEIKPEVIKAQKVELPGLKVLGKIEFPEPKKKEATPEAGKTPDAQKTSRPEARKWKPGNERRDQRPKKNPVVLEREREAMEAEKKRKADLERKKELKTQHYYKKIKPAPPTKAMKLVNDEVEEISTEHVEQPKSRIGRFFRWLTT